MKIVVNPLDPKSVSDALKLVQKYKKDFLEKEQEFVRRLAEIGVRVAGGVYSAADPDGEHQLSVRMEKTSEGYIVKAEGDTIGFLEFGTGIKNREWDNTGVDYTPPAHGTYGKGRGKQPWGWWFNSEQYGVTMHTYGNQPAEGMLSARNEMIERVTQIAREVWQ
jgi:hypothetical protein